MNRHFLSFLFVLASAIATNFFAQRVWAQAPAPGVMTATDVATIKSIKIGNLDKDTYFKSGNFILDRYEERPPYVFNYSDGISRKIYLYKVYAAADTRELGLLAVYQNGKTGDLKPFVIPGANADRKAWDLYIDDLKYVGEKEPGLMSALGFVLSREMATLLAGGAGAKTDDGKKKEEYNFCFAPEAPVTLPNGTTKAIAELNVGDVILGYDAPTHTLVPTRITGVQAHAPVAPATQIGLSGVWLTPAEGLTAARTLPEPMLFEATPNHPVLTATGRKPLAEVHTGETLYRHELGALVPYRVVRTSKITRFADTVYTLSTDRGAFLIDDTLVLDK
ncbi:Hint domain-containing protein [Rudanella lutea]|uniref:Hint domain-containing protein n=1 Tax=Rudanella lutea TaxID=451374 RepID=UPI0003817B41|nr:Hint domain-containing protein [Rudanella lutea]